MMETLTKLDQEVTRTLTLVRTRFPSHSFPDPKVTMDLTGKAAGQFWMKKGVPSIRFNLALMLENKEGFLCKTVPHEVAHYVVSIIDPHSKPHGSTWQAVMKLFGVENPQTYHSYRTTEVVRRKQPYIYQCSCQKHFFTKQKHSHAKQGTRYICNVCKGICQYIGKKETLK